MNEIEPLEPAPGAVYVVIGATGGIGTAGAAPRHRFGHGLAPKPAE